MAGQAQMQSMPQQQQQPQQPQGLMGGVDMKKSYPSFEEYMRVKQMEDNLRELLQGVRGDAMKSPKQPPPSSGNVNTIEALLKSIIGQ